MQINEHLNVGPCRRPVARLFCGGGQIGQILGPFMITGGLSCDRVEFGHFGGGGGGSDDPPDPPLATGLLGDEKLTWTAVRTCYSSYSICNKTVCIFLLITHLL